MWGVNDDTVREALNDLRRSNLLFDGDVAEIEGLLRDWGFVRAKEKAEYICEARQRFFDEESEQYEISIVLLVGGLTRMEPVEARSALVDRIQIRGMGMKTASHFLRGLGLSRNQLAILDKRILEWLVRFGVIDEAPKYLSKKRYLEIEKRMKDWQMRKASDIRMDALDWLLWTMKDC